MIYDYYGYYETPATRLMNGGIFLIGAAILAMIVGVVLFVTFMSKKHEGKLQGFLEKVYNFLNFNRFYAENLVRLLYVIAVCVLVLVGIALMLLGLDAHASAIFWMGAWLLVLGNLAARICCELVMMFIILCRKTVSVDRRLSKIEGAFTAEPETEDGVDDAAAMYDDPAAAAWRSEADTKAATETETASAYRADPQEADAEPAQTAQAGQETTEPVAEADEAAETAAENLDENAKSANPQELQ